MKKVCIQSGPYKIIIDLLDTHTAKIIYSKLLIIGKINFWENETYFNTSLKIKIEINARQVVKKGELAYWLQGDDIAIGYAPTPISLDNEIRLASPCNVWGITKFDLDQLNSLPEQQEIIISNV